MPRLTPLAAAAALSLLASPAALASPQLLPADLKTRYLSMNFTVDGQRVQFSLDKLQYQNLGRKVLERMPLKNKMLQLTNAELKKDAAGVAKLAAPVKIKNNDALFMHVFSGKGSPDEIAAVLKLAARFNQKLGKDWKDKGDLSATLKQFYWDNIGLDCSGFAGNYARAVGSRYGPETSILGFAPASKRIKKLADVKPGDVMVWKDNQHITTIQGKRADGNYDVVESNGDRIIFGLGKTVWQLKEPDASGLVKATRIFEGGKKSNPASVYLASVK